MFKKYWKFFVVFWSVFVAFILFLFVFFALVAKGKMGFMPTFEELENPNNKFASEIYFEDGPMISRYYIGSENRRYTGYREIPQSVIDALVATEDARYYEHSGIDVRGLFRVMKGVLTASVSSAGGGSTITQQLAKMLFPREANQSKLKLIVRKFREWVIAVQLEKNYTKEEIITMYLNKFDFLNLAVGINSAAEIYFQQPLDSLRTEQAAMLVGMAKNPTLFNPVRRPDKALDRRNVVLGQMYKYHKISKEIYDSLKVLPLEVNFKREDHKEGLATYFREYLRVYITANKPEKKNYRWNKEQYKVDSLAWLTDPLYGWCNKNQKLDGGYYDLYADGLKIHTTLNSHMQKYAEESVVEHLSKDLQPQFDGEGVEKTNPPFSNDITPQEVEAIQDVAIKRTERYAALRKAGMTFAQIKKEFDKVLPMQIFTWQGVKDTLMSPLDSLKHYKGFFRAGFMVMDPQTGHVKAYVGGPNYKYFMYDMVSVGKRQAGSTIKPILYTLAMQEGLGPCDEVPNIPQAFVLPNGDVWSARGGGGKSEGEMVTLRWGLANSENNVSGWVLKQFTPYAVAQMAYRMGIQSRIDPVPSIFLGTAEISVKELVAAYAIYANKGVYNAPLMVSRIEDRYGNTLADFHAESKEIITARTAYLMCNLLEGVIDEGTGKRLRFKYGLRNPMGGKTGTTQRHSDGWFMAVTPELVGGVWVGAEDRNIHFQELRYGQGANMALPIWGLFLQKVMKDPKLNFAGKPFEKPIGMRENLNCREDELPIEEEVEEGMSQENPDEIEFVLETELVPEIAEEEEYEQFF